MINRADAYELYKGQSDPVIGMKHFTLLEALAGMVTRDKKLVRPSDLEEDLALFENELDEFAAGVPAHEVISKRFDVEDNARAKAKAKNVSTSKNSASPMPQSRKVFSLVSNPPPSSKKLSPSSDKPFSSASKLASSSSSVATVRFVPMQKHVALKSRHGTREPVVVRTDSEGDSDVEFVAFGKASTATSEYYFVVPE